MDRRLAETGNYEIDWQEAYGGSIVKPRGVLEGIRLGLGDIGIVTTIFHNSALPSQAISAVSPFISTDARVVARAVDEIAKEFPQIEAEFAAQNQVYLATGVVLDTYQVFSTEPMSGLGDLEGGKMAGAGYNLRYLEGLNDVAGVRGGLTDFYNMLQTGVVDHAMLWPEAAMTFKIHEVAPHMLRANIGSVNSKTVTVNAGCLEWASGRGEAGAVRRSPWPIAITCRQRGHGAGGRERCRLPGCRRDRGRSVGCRPRGLGRVDAQHRPGMGRRYRLPSGGPGSDMLTAYVGKLRDAGQVPVRDWAAELTN